jgi:tyrosyl-tRNA synthetase
MSKSLGNAIGVTEPADEMFGKVMSVSDELMWRYYVLLTDLGPAEIETRRQAVTAGTLHPKQAKMDLARAIVADFHSAAEAEAAAAAFDARFARGELAVERLPEVRISVAEDSIGLPKLVAEAGLASSTSEAARKIQQGGVRVDREKVTGVKTRVAKARGAVVLEAGRHAVRIVFE